MIVRMQPKRDLVIEAPHVPYDHDSDVEAASVFDKTGAHAAFFAGADRCVLKATSGCSKNDGCDAKTSVPALSDPAHSVTSAFHAFHLAVGTALVLQLHTNDHPQDNGDALVSNATTLPYSSNSLVKRFADALKTASKADVRTCNDPAARPRSAAKRTRRGASATAPPTRAAKTRPRPPIASCTSSRTSRRSPCRASPGRSTS
jgi:hypothetical protein